MWLVALPCNGTVSRFTRRLARLGVSRAGAESSSPGCATEDYRRCQGVDQAAQSTRYGAGPCYSWRVGWGACDVLYRPFCAAWAGSRATNLKRSTHLASTEWCAPAVQRHEAENVSLTKSLMVVQVRLRRCWRLATHGRALTHVLGRMCPVSLVLRPGCEGERAASQRDPWVNGRQPGAVRRASRQAHGGTCITLSC